MRVIHFDRVKDMEQLCKTCKNDCKRPRVHGCIEFNCLKYSKERKRK